MLIKERRPMTEAERATLETVASYTRQQDGCLDRAGTLFLILGLSFLFGGLLVFLPLLAWDWLAGLLHKPTLSHTTYSISLGLGGSTGLALSAWHWYWGEKESRLLSEKTWLTYQQELESGEAEVWHCDISRVIELEQMEDEVPGFFLEIGSSEVLFLQGQYFDEFGVASHDDEGEMPAAPQDDPGVWPPSPKTGSSSVGYAFPCSRFDLIYSPQSRTLLNLVCLSPTLKTWPTCEWPEDMKDYPGDSDILPVSLDNLDADLRHWAAQQGQGEAGRDGS